MGVVEVVKRRVRSAERFAALVFLWRFSSLKRVRDCSRVPHSKGLVDLGVSGGRFSTRGVVRCASVWACPVCAPKIRQQRADEIKRAVLEHKRRGGEAMFLTLTVPHDQGDDLDALWRTVAGCWSKLIAHRRFVDAMRTAGVVGSGSRVEYVRVIEVTHGPNGWHPHIHAVLLVDRLPGQYEAWMRGEIHAAWASLVQGEGWRAPSLAVGVDLQSVRSHRAVSEYLQKVDGVRVDMELTRADLKRAAGGYRTPWQILADVVARAGAALDHDGDSVVWGSGRDAALWWSWERVSHGKRMCTWSVGTKKRLGVDEVTDEAAAAEVVGHETVAMVDGKAWRAVCGSDLVVTFCEAIEQGLRDVVEFVLDELGHGDALREWRGLPSPAPPP